MGSLMMPEAGQSRRLCAAFALALLGLAAVGAMMFAPTSPAEAQFFERRQRPDGFNPFGFIFGGRPNEPREYQRDRWERRAPRQAQPAQAEQTRPPPPQKHDTPPSKHIVVMGTSLSDWLAYGLEEIYADQPEVGIVRKNQLFSGLVKFDAKEEQTWPQVARDFLKDQSADVIVVILGLEDRQTIRVKPPAPKPEEEAQSAQSTAKPEARRRPQSFEFRTDEWAEVYSKRIDEMIAALKSKGVPVIWVGLPAIRGTRSTSDMIYLNDLFRARADRAGIVYVDVWDGFVNEAGRYSAYGPDVEGQVRRLRTSEGVYMTKFGARKLAHYVEREISRVMGTRLQLMSVPTQDESGQPMTARPGEGARPVAGPVVPLTNPASADELLGASMRPGATDPLAARVLVKGSPVAPPTGRADNFFLTKEAAEAAAAAQKTLEAEEAEARALAARSRPAPRSSTPVIGDEPKANEQPERAARAASPGSDPAGAPATSVRRPTPPRSAERRVQQPYRPLSQDPRLVPPRDVEPRRQRPPIFDPFGLFR